MGWVVVGFGGCAGWVGLDGVLFVCGVCGGLGGGFGLCGCVVVVLWVWWGVNFCVVWIDFIGFSWLGLIVLYCVVVFGLWC